LQKLRTANRFHRPSLLLALLFSTLSLLSLSACAVPDTPVPTVTPRPPTNVPTLRPTSDPTCPTVALENWLRNATANTESFINLLNRSGATKQADAKRVASQLAQFEILINRVAAPSCAIAVNTQINTMINDAVQAFMTLSSDPRTSVQNAMAVATVRYSQIQKDQQALLVILNKQLGQ
jgi:hypothetical protein